MKSFTKRDSKNRQTTEKQIRKPTEGTTNESTNSNYKQKEGKAPTGRIKKKRQRIT